MQIACGNDAMWHRLCTAFDIAPGDARYATNADRVANREKLTELLESVFAGHEPDALLNRLADARIPAIRRP